MKVRNVKSNNHRREFEVKLASGKDYVFPYGLCETKPAPENRIRELYVDEEVGNEGFTYVLESGDEGTILADYVLEYNEDPEYMVDLLMHKLTVEANQRFEASGFSIRQLARRMSTSVPQLYRLLDTANYSKSMQQLVTLLGVLGCEVEVVLKEKESA